MEGYTLLEYIESTGTQYIDTGFKHNQNTRVIMHVKPTGTLTANAFLFDGPTDDNSRKGVFYHYSKKKWAVDYNSSSNRTYISETSINADFQIDYDKNVCSINAEMKTFAEKTFQSTVNLTLLASNFGGNPQSFISAKLYSCQIYDNGVLIRDYIPAMNGGGVYGLFDKVNGEFYVSATDSGFTGKWAEHKVLNVSMPEYRHRMLNLIQKRGLPDYSSYRGVYIEDVDGYLYTEAEWDGSKTPNGVAVLTDNCRFVIALQNAHTTVCKWSSSVSLVNGVTTTTSESEAKVDYDGEAQTTTILSELGDSSSIAPAVHYCRAFTFPNGKKGYLGALGEWDACYSNKTDVETALNKCGGGVLSFSYWSSTQYDASYMWVRESTYYSQRYKNGASNNRSYPRAFATLKSDD